MPRRVPCMHEGTSIMHVGEVSLGDVDHGWFRGYGSSAWDHVLPVMEQLAFLYRETYALLLE
jgi:hypothetical protein